MAWAVTDITDVTVREVDLVYLYRPVRPDRPLGDRFYRRLVADLVASDRPVTVLSVADPLDELLPPAVTRVSDDGHLAIFRHEPVPPVASTAMADRSSASTVPSSVQSGFPGTDAP